MSNRSKIVLIGSGNLASNLGPGLNAKGYDIVQVYSQSSYKARKLAKALGAKATNKIENITPIADLYFVLVPDEHILAVTKKLCKVIEGQSQSILHSSGATALITSESIKSKALSKKISKHQISFGVFYPLQSFKKSRTSDFKNIPILLETTNESDQDLLQAIAKKLSKKVVTADSETRLKYHLSAVLVNNFVTHLFCKNKQFIEANEMDPSILDPIIDLTFSQLRSENPCNLQTGPAKRKDHGTMEKHLELIKKDKALAQVYIQISKSIAKSAL